MPIRGEAQAVLSDGRKLTFKVNFATLARVAVQTQLAAPLVLPVMTNKDDPRQMMVFLAMVEQSLKKHHPGVDEDEIGDLMLTDGDALSAALNAAAEGAFGGDDEEGKDGKNPPTKNGTGTSSKSHGRKRDKTPASSGNKHRAASGTS